MNAKFTIYTYSREKGIAEGIHNILLHIRRILFVMLNTSWFSEPIKKHSTIVSICWKMKNVISTVKRYEIDVWTYHDEWFKNVETRRCGSFQCLTIFLFSSRSFIQIITTVHLEFPYLGVRNIVIPFLARTSVHLAHTITILCTFIWQHPPYGSNKNLTATP